MYMAGGREDEDRNNINLGKPMDGWCHILRQAPL